MKLASIIIVSFNGKQFIKDCLNSIYRQTYRKFEVIVVDNASTDGSADFIKSKYPKVKLIRSETNLGFASANNLGIRKSKGEYIVLLNQDTAVHKDWLKELVNGVNKENVGACQSKILFFNKRNVINTSGTIANYLGFGWCGDYNKPDEGLEEAEITFPSGSSVIFKKEVLNKTGLFDDNFFMYYEDSDLGWRIRLLGYKITRAPLSVMYHKYKFESEEDRFKKKIKDRKKIFYHERNRIVTILKNYEAKTLFLILPPLILTEVGVLFYSLKKGWFFEKLRTYYWIATNIEDILEKRKHVQKTRKILDKEIVKYFTDKMESEEAENNILLNYLLNPISSLYWRVIKPFI